MKFNEKIVALRKIKGITQDELASAVGVSRQAVYKWECGQSYPEVAKLVELKLLFNVSIDDLLDENYEISIPEKKKRKRLPKAEKAVIEKEVRESLVTEVIRESAEAQTAAEEKENEKAAAAVATSSEKTEKENAAPISPIAPSAPAEAAEETSADTVEKKKGFFGRIFGRK